MFVHTAHGRGRIVDEQSVRGRKSFLVEGSGFSVWVDEKDLRVANEVNHDNSTTLPYDPTPQHPADMFVSESTMQPDYGIDADERLSPSDSLTFEDESLDYPGPSPDNFAKEGSFLGDLLDRLPQHEWDEDSVRDWVRRHDPHGSVEDEDESINFRSSDKHALPFLRNPEENYEGRHRRPPAPEMDLGGGKQVWDSRDWAEANPDPNLTGPSAFTDPREIDRYKQWQDKYLGRGELYDRGLNTYEPIYAGKHSYPGDGNYEGRHRTQDLEPTIGEKSNVMGDLFDALYNMGLPGNIGPIPIPGITAAKDEECCDDEWDEDDDAEIKHFSHRQAAGLEQFAESGLEDATKDAIDALTRGGGGLPGGSREEGESPRGAKGFSPKEDIENLVEDFAGDQNKKEVGGRWPGRPDAQVVTSSLYERPAGLSDKYIRVAAPVDHYSDPVQQFRDDPVGFINKRGYMMSDSVDIRLAEYIDLVDYDSDIRTAAWRDVRSKALRLRREGRVHVKDLAPDRIYANVQGDSDTYETMILKGGGNGQSISDWHCSCPWGRWAFKRQMSYVGRLCSHGYASYLEMESQQMKANNKRRKSAANNAELVKELMDKWQRKEPTDDGYTYDKFNFYSDTNHIPTEELSSLSGIKPSVVEERRNYLKELGGSRTAGIVEDFKQWADNENDGMIDQQAIDNYIYLLNSQHDGDHTVVSEDDAEKLYDALDDMKSTGMERDYDVDYLERPGDVYKDAAFDKEADVLSLRPLSLTPDFYVVEDGADGQFWTDVESDERKTTGPDNMVKESGYFGDGQDNDWRDEGYYDDETDKGDKRSGVSGMLRMLFDPHTATRRLTGRELHYASDDELFDCVKDWAGAGSKLEKLRGLSEEEPDLQNKREQNDEIRSVIDELHDRGIDASQFVASLRFAGAGHDHGDEDDDKTPASEQGQPDMSGAPNQTGQPGGSSSITKADSSQTPSTPNAPTNPTSSGSSSAKSTAGATNDLAGATNDPASVGFNGEKDNPQNRRAETGYGDGPNLGAGIDAGEVMSTLGQAAGGFASALPSMMYALPSVAQSVGQLGAGIGSGLSGLASGLSGILASQHNATPVGGFPNVQLTNQESFQGSGPNPKYWMGSSECYVDDHERDRFVDLTDLDDDPLIKYTDENPGQGPKKASRSRRPLANSADSASVDNANPQTSTLTSGSGMNDTTAINFDQVRKAGSSDKPWDGHRVRDFRRFVRQNGGQVNHQMLQEYLSKPRRGLEQGGQQHLQDYTSYAEQHEKLGAADLGAADVPDSFEAIVPEAIGGEDSSDIVAAFHRMGGIEAINNSGGGGSYSDAAIAEQAKGFLRTAGRMYSLAEQRELENEAHPKGARNLNELDLAGTHYEDAL